MTPSAVIRPKAVSVTRLQHSLVIDTSLQRFLEPGWRGSAGRLGSRSSKVEDLTGAAWVARGGEQPTLEHAWSSMLAIATRISGRRPCWARRT